MQLRYIRGLLSILLVALPVVAQPDLCPESLVVLPGAVDVDCGPYLNTHQVSYSLDVAFPANESIHSLVSSLRALGWYPIAEDILNPDQASAHCRGWSKFGDSSASPSQEVHQWIGDWINLNQGGEALRFVLRYSSSKSGQADLNALIVRGTLIPANEIRLVLEPDFPDENGVYTITSTSKIIAPVLIHRGSFNLRDFFGDSAIPGPLLAMLVVDSDGSVSSVEVVEGISPEVDAAFIADAKTYRFEPATLDGVPVAVRHMLIAGAPINPNDP